ncbi:MAG: hypothetical protein ABR588_05225 [Sphingomicrobium sp.]|nr:hypothetical protein [Sphingomonadales bacterium]
MSMIFGAGILMAALQADTATSAGRRVVATTVVPPPFVTVVDRAAESALVNVRISSPEGLIWQDTLRVGRNSGASYSQDKSEAGPVECTGGSYDRSRRSSLRVQLYLRDGSEHGPVINVAVNWTHPNAIIGCQQSGTRGVQLEESLPLARGQSETLQADGGLTITLMRR